MRPIGTFPLPPSQIQALTLRGYQNEEHVVNVSPSQLSNEIHVSLDVAQKIINTVRQQGSLNASHSSNVFAFTTNQCKSARKLLAEEENAVGIVTFCAALDDLLGGGVETGKVTEVCGPPGIGKTQLGLQLAVDVQIPSVFGGLAGHAIYIDTEGGLTPDRIATVAESALRHLNQVADSENDEELRCEAKRLSVERFLENIHVYRCHDYTQLIALSHILDGILHKIGNVKVIVVDSIAFPLRHSIEDFGLRSRILQGLGQGFLKLATKYNAAVVLTSQMTTKLDKQTDDYSLAPALGDGWSHICSVRLILSWKTNKRCAHLYKTQSQDEQVFYTIMPDGVRDAEGYIQKNAEKSLASVEDLSTPPPKRTRTEQ